MPAYLARLHGPVLSSQPDTCSWNDVSKIFRFWSDQQSAGAGTKKPRQGSYFSPPASVLRVFPRSLLINGMQPYGHRNPTGSSLNPRQPASIPEPPEPYYSEPQPARSMRFARTHYWPSPTRMSMTRRRSLGSHLGCRGLRLLGFGFGRCRMHASRLGVDWGISDWVMW